MLISPHFSLVEMTRSDYALRHGIDNTPPPEAAAALTRLCNSLLERIRGYIANNKPIHITSGYRCPMLNTAIGGSPPSQHMKGEAADFVIPGMSHRAVIQAVLDTPQIAYDQLIYEGGEKGWIHVSYSLTHLRHQILTATFDPSGKVTYSPFV